MKNRFISKVLKIIGVVLFAVLAFPKVVNSPVEAQTSPLSNIKHIFIIVMENHDWSAITPSAAPYLNNTLIPMGARPSNYHNVPTSLGSLHPSEPNYIFLEAGTNSFSDHTFTNDNNASGSNSTSSTSHLATLLKNKGLTWRAYQENMPAGTCPISSSGQYAAKHNPFVFFQDVSGSPPSSSNQYCASNHEVLTTANLQNDLDSGNVANYNFLTPNICNDMHDCSVTTGDNWLKTYVPIIMNSAAYKNDGAIFITWDEGGSGNNPIGMIILSPFVKPGYTNTNEYSHASFVKTVQNTFGLTPYLGHAADSNVADLSAFFTSPTNPTPTPVPGQTATPTPTVFLTPTPTVTPTPTPKPDLVITSFTPFPYSPVNGDSVSFTVSIKNQGFSATPDGVTTGIGFYIDGSATANTWSDNYSTSIPPGGEVTLETNGPNWTATTGTHSVTAFVDDVDRIPEEDETNNTFTQDISVSSTNATPTPIPNGTDLSLVPSIQTLPVGASGVMSVYVDPQGKQVSSMELVIKFNPNVVRVDDITPGPFFTDPGIGAPVVIKKSIDNTNGLIDYSIGFPLGSNYSSTASKVAAIISYTALNTGTSIFSYQTTGFPITKVVDINAVNVLATTNDATVIVGNTSTPSPKPTGFVSATPTIQPLSVTPTVTLSSTPVPSPTPTTKPTSTPTPTPKPTATVTPKPTATVTPKPTSAASPTPSVTGAMLLFTPTSESLVGLGRTGTINAFIEPNSENVSSIEFVINFDPQVIKVDDITPGAFFTNPGIGNPIEVVKTIDNSAGQIHYALGFPLGSGYFSTSSNVAAVISFTTLGAGTSPLTYITTGNPHTKVSDINARNVLGSVSPGSITVLTSTPTPTPKVTATAIPTPTSAISGAILSVTPTSQTITGTNIDKTVSVYLDPNGTKAASVELLITFDPSVIKVNDITPGPFFTGYSGGDPVEITKNIDNTNGKIYYALGFPLGSQHYSTSADIVAKISFTTLDYGNSPVNFVTSGTPSTRVSDINAIDVLAQTNNGSVIVASTTPEPTTTITPTPGPINYEGCLKSDGDWQSVDFPTQTGSFTAEFDITPSSSDKWPHYNFIYVGFAAPSRFHSRGYPSLGAIISFSPSHKIFVRNGHHYDSQKTLTYENDKTYHIRLVIDMTNHTYSVYITPEGGTEIALAVNYPFRIEQRHASSFSQLVLYARTKWASAELCDLTITPEGGSSQPTPTPKPITSVTPTPADLTPTPTPFCKANNGDHDDDGDEDDDDFKAWHSNYNKTTNRGPKDGDFNCSGRVDGVDYVIWMNGYRHSHRK